MLFYLAARIRSSRAALLATQFGISSPSAAILGGTTTPAGERWHSRHGRSAHTPAHRLFRGPGHIVVYGADQADRVIVIGHCEDQGVVTAGARPVART
jgi:hypothetical protein